MKTEITNRIQDIVADASMDSLRSYVIGKIIEGIGKKLSETHKAGAMRLYEDLNEKPHLICECILRPYTMPKKYEYSDAVKKMEVKLKALKKDEEANGTATPIISEDPTLFTVLT